MKEVRKPTFSSSEVILVQGLPGMGLVAKMTADYLIEVYNGQKVACVYSSFFPPIVRLDKGIGKLARLELYEITSLHPNMLVLTGDSQPADIGIIGVIRTILHYAIHHGITTTAAFGGLRTEEDHDVAGFGYTSESLDWLSQEVQILDEGEISGAVGVLTALAHTEFNLRSYGLLGKLTMGVADPSASKRVLKAFSNLHELDPPLTDFSWLDKKIQEAQKTEIQAQDFYKQATAQFAQSEDENPGYYI